jgi:hypothetical protein
MPTFNKKKSWTVQDVKKAMKSVQTAKINAREAAGRFNLPKSSLQDYISEEKKRRSEVDVTSKLGRS